MKKLTALFLSILMIVSMMQPSVIFAMDDEVKDDDAPVVTEETIVEEVIDESVVDEVIEISSLQYNLDLIGDIRLNVNAGNTITSDSWLDSDYLNAVSYMSIDTNVATVDANGDITGVSSGVTNIVASNTNGNTYIAVVSVSDSIMTIVDTVLTAYNGDGGKLVIPYGVTEIKENFESTDDFDRYDYWDSVENKIYGVLHNKGITSVEFPTTLKKIGSYAFFGNALTHVVFPEGLEVIGVHAFGENRLKSVSFPSTLQTIYGYAFSDNLIEKVVLPNNLENLYSGAFYNNKISDLQLSGSISKIGEFSFMYNNIMNLVVPEGIVEIGESAFELNYIYSVSFPSTLRRIDESVFENNRIQKLILPEGLESVGIRSFYKNLINYLSIPSTLKVIEQEVFAGNELREVVIPDGVEKITTWAFRGNELNQIYIPKSVKTIGDNDSSETWQKDAVAYVYEGSVAETFCIKNESKYKTVNDLNAVFEYTNIYVDIIHPRDKWFFIDLEKHGLTASYSIDDTTIAKVDSNGNIEGLKPGVTTLTTTLSNGSVFKTVISVSNDEFIINNRIAIDYRGLNSSIIIPNGVKEIEKSYDVQFWDVSEGEEIERVKIGFENKGLKEVKFPNSLEIIGDKAFKDNHIISITIPEGVTTIGEYAFNCTSLNCNEVRKPRIIILPSTLTSFDSSFGWHDFRYYFVKENSYAAEKLLKDYDPEYSYDRVFVYDDNFDGNPILPESITLNESNITLEKGETFQLVATITPSNVNVGSKIRWSTYSPDSHVTVDDCVTVDENGLVTAVRVGTTTVYAKTENGLVASCDVTVPATLAPIQVVNKGNNSIKVSWNVTNGATGYEVYRSTSYDGSFKKVGTVKKGSTTSWTDTNVTVGTTYYYKVLPYAYYYGYKIYGSYSKTQGFALLKVPSVTVKRYSYDSLTISWKAVSKAEKYEVYRSTSKDKNFELVTTVTDLSYVDTNLLTAKTYYYKVKAVKNCTTQDAKSSFSTVQSAKTTLTTPKAIVTNPAYNRNELTWAEVDGADGYEVVRATKKDGKYVLIDYTTSNSYVDINVVTGQTYYYKIRAYRNNLDETRGYSSYSAIVNKKVTIATPKVTITNPNYTKNELDWQDVALAKGYEVYRATKKDGKYTKVDTVSESNYIDTNVVLGKTYYYKVRVVVDVNGMDKYSSYSAIVNKKVTIATPKVTVTNPNYQMNILDWQDVELATGYEVYRATSKSGKYTKVATITESNYKDTNVVLGKTYYYKVRAVVDSNGTDKYSSYSSIVNKKVVIAAPKVSIPVSNFEMNALIWDHIEFAKEYEVYRATSKTGKYTKVATVLSSDYVDTTVVLGKTYYYKVRAKVDVNGTDKYSSYSSIVSKKVVLPAPTNIVAYQSGKFDAHVDFDYVYGANGYETFRAKSKKGEYEIMIRATGPDYIDHNLDRNKTYYYKARAYRVVNGKRVYSAFTEVVSVTIVENWKK